MGQTLAPFVIADEIAARDGWVAQHLRGGAQPPFSFVYDGRPASALLGHWHRTCHATPFPPTSSPAPARPGSGPTTGTPAAGDGRTSHVVSYRDPASGLAVQCVAVTYAAFPTVEWTVHLRNEGTADTPVIEAVQALDLNFAPPGADHGADQAVPPRGIVLHHAVGSPARADDYRPLETVLRAGVGTHLAARGGRPSDTDLPFANLQWPGGGVIVAVGWPGQWAASFQRDACGNVRLRAGQAHTRFVLHPGEAVRSPLMVLQHYRMASTAGGGQVAGGPAGERATPPRRDWITAQNVWRRWMLAHNVPRVAGAVPEPFTTASSSSQFHEMEQATEENQCQFIDAYLAHNVPLDYWWMDAGWYVTASGHWPETGTWEVDRRRFPRGLRGVADHAHARGVKILVWFEPERVAAGTWLDEAHPEWLLAAPGARSRLLDLGNPEACAWAIEHFDRLIQEQGVDLYRQDFNLPPLEHWRAADQAAGRDGVPREGIAEIRHVTGYLAYWDELRRRHPALVIDTCASGGRRNDLETLRRAIPLHVTDHDYGDYVARQSHAYGLSLWTPLFGAAVCKRDSVDVYATRSAVGTRLGMGFDVRRPDLDWVLLRRLVREWRAAARALHGDFYPLTAHSIDQRDWLAFQHDLPQQGEGVLHVFRRAESPYVAAQFRLRGLEPAATYEVRDLDDVDDVDDVDDAGHPGEDAQPEAGVYAGRHTELHTGRVLMDDGLPVAIAAQPAAKVFVYRRQ